MAQLKMFSCDRCGNKFDEGSQQGMGHLQFDVDEQLDPGDCKYVPVSSYLDLCTVCAKCLVYELLDNVAIAEQNKLYKRFNLKPTKGK